MKPLRVILTFLTGAIVASAVWGVLLVRCQFETATTGVSSAYQEARFSERILTYLDHPDPVEEHLLIFTASNHIAGFSYQVEYWDKRYPYLSIERRAAFANAGFQMFLQTNGVLRKAQQPNTALEPTATVPSVSTNK